MEDVEGSSRAAIARRLITVMDLLGRGDSYLSAILGYANPSTIYKVRRGETLLGPTKLSMIAELEVEQGLYPNLHWILTGRGETLVSRGQPARSYTLAALAQAQDQEFLAARSDRSSALSRRIDQALRRYQSGF